MVSPPLAALLAGGGITRPMPQMTGRDGEAEWGYRSRCLDLWGVGYFVGIKILQKRGYFLVFSASRIWVPQVWHWIGGWPIPRSIKEHGHVVPWKPTWSTPSRVLDTIFPPEMAVVGFHVKPPISPVWVGHFIVALKGAINNPGSFMWIPVPLGSPHCHWYLMIIPFTTTATTTTTTAH